MVYVFLFVYVYLCVGWGKRMLSEKRGNKRKKKLFFFLLMSGILDWKITQNYFKFIKCSLITHISQRLNILLFPLTFKSSSSSFFLLFRSLSLLQTNMHTSLVTTHPSGLNLDNSAWWLRVQAL